MNTELPSPMVPPEVDLRGYDFMPFFGDALDRSDFNKTSNDTAWRFGVMLWWEAWAKQVPAASLPDDDALLTRACGLGRDTETFLRIKAEALHGFVKCSDGRLYHTFLSGHAIEAYEGRVKQRIKTTAARIGALKKRVTESVTDAEKMHLNGLIHDLEQSLLQATKGRNPKSVTDKPTDTNTPPVLSQSQNPQGEGEGQREGQRQDKEKSNSTADAAAENPAEFAPLPEVPTNIAHYSNFLRRHGMDAVHTMSVKSRTLFREWVARGITFAVLEDALEVARERNGALPISPVYLREIVNTLTAQPAAPAGEPEQGNGTRSVVESI